MARPVKCRTVCHYPQTLEFRPAQEDGDQPCIILTVDEFETIRLLDKEGLSQQQCSELMQVGRTTVQKIYESARRKIASSLVEGRTLRIVGGDFQLCDGGRQCSISTCSKRRYHREKNNSKGETQMTIAVTYENGQIFQHFGHTAQFKLYHINDERIITSSEVVDTNGSGHGTLAGILQAMQVNVLICGGIGGGAQMALASAGIQLFGGCSGSADEAVQALLDGQLLYNPHVQCSHHDHHGEGHSCGDHGCGNHCGHH